MIEIIDLLKPKNGGSFKLIEDIDIAVSGYSSLADCVAHMATTAMIEAINAVLSGKQDKLTTAQLAACNSGITSELVAQINANALAIEGKAAQSDLTALQAVVNGKADASALATTNATLATKADASDLATATASLQAQIDAIVTPVTQDAEVQNARVDAEGVTHATLKARIDSTETDIRNTLEQVVLYSNRCPCTANAHQVASDVTVDTITPNSFSIYGTCSGRRVFMIFGGDNTYGDTHATLNKRLPAGQYTFKYTCDGFGTDVRFYYTESDLDNGTLLENGDVFTLSNSGGIAIECLKDTNFGIESNRTLITFNLYSGDVDYPLISGDTANDFIAREQISEVSTEVTTARVDNNNVTYSSLKQRLDTQFEYIDNLLDVTVSNVSPCTPSASQTANGVTCLTISNNQFAVYGTCTGRQQFRIFGGENTYGAGVAFTNYLTSGTYTFLSSIEGTNIDVKYTETTFAEGVVLRSGDIFTISSGGILYVDALKNTNYGTQQEPTIINFNVYRGEVDYPLISHDSITDEIARKQIEADRSTNSNAIKALNAMPCTQGVTLTNYDVTVETLNDNQFKIYGTCSGAIRFLVFGGNASTVGGGDTGTKNLPAGTYRFKTDNVNTYLEIWYSTGTTAQGTKLINDDVFTIQSAGYLFIVVAKDAVYGTQQNPTIVTFSVSEGSEDYELSSVNVTAVDRKARAIDTHTDLVQAMEDAHLQNSTIINSMSYHLESTGENVPTYRKNDVLSGAQALLRRHELKDDKIRFAFITDVHIGGSRTTTYNSSNNIEIFNTIANEFADFAVMSGDLITNYYDSTYMKDTNDVKTALAEGAAMFTNCTVPLLMVKGNHDLGLNGYTAVSTPVSYATGYYIYLSDSQTYKSVKSETEFNAYKLAGEQFYVSSVTPISNEEYYDLVQADYCQNCVFGSSKCGYYYYDVPNKNVRIIVINEFYLDNGEFVIDSTQETFVSSALTSALSANKAVIIIGHTDSYINHFTVAIRAFINAGGKFIGYIHGHEHSDVYKNNYGYNDIGVNWGCIANADVPSLNGFCFDVFELDLSSETLNEVRVGVWREVDSNRNNLYRSHNRKWSYRYHRPIL